MIPFNKPFLTGKELEYIRQAVKAGKLSGNGTFTQSCHQFFEQRYGFGKCLLTTSCTDALEMAAILLNMQPGDEVIMPSYTFVSTANAFVLRGARIVFVDSRSDRPGMDEVAVEALVTKRTKAIVVVHYAGVACDMDVIMDIANRHNLFVVEDAAQAIDSFYKGKPLGSIGHLAAFSFHETKNIQCGEGGMLVVNDMQFAKRAEIIWEKGTNRAAFWRGEVDKYGWVDVGSSFLPSEITAAFLLAQLDHLDEIQRKRQDIWQRYYNSLRSWGEECQVDVPVLPGYSTNNGHMFYLVCPSSDLRTGLIGRLKENNILATFHYQCLHLSLFYRQHQDARPLPNAVRFTDAILRLPLYYEISNDELDRVTHLLITY